MSLPAAKQSIGDRPPKDSVTVPNNKELLEKDVDRKMRLYGVIQAFRQGRMPDNAQIDETLKYVVANSPIDEQKLSPEGRKLVQDTRDVIETARLIVKEKNADEIFQNFVFLTSGAEVKKPEGSVTEGASSTVDKDQDAKLALHHIRTLFNLLVTNAEMRKLLKDSTVILRDLFATGAVNVAERVRPTSEEMNKVDHPAPGGVWLGSTDERPDVAAAAAAPAPTAPEPAQPAASSPPSSPTKASRRDSSTGSDPGKRSLKSRFLGVKQKIPDEHRDRARQEFTAAKDHIVGQFPAERRDQYYWRLKKVVTECQSNPSYQQSVTWFMDTFRNYFETAVDSGKSAGNKTSDFLSGSPQLKQALEEFRTLLERFANGRSMQPFIDAVRMMIEDAKEDQELRQWWEKIGAFVRSTLLEPGFIISPLFNQRSKELQDSAKEFFNGRYAGHKDTLLDQAQVFLQGFQEDPLNKRFGNDWTKLAKDLLFNEEGDLTFKPVLWRDIEKVILPSFLEKVGYVPIPRIEYTDKNLDLVIENLTLQGRNLFPNIVEIDNRNYFKLSPYAQIGDVQHHTLTLTLSQIQADMRDVAFYYKKKSGVPKISDSGLADVFVGGNGVTARVKITTQNAGRDIFKVREVIVKVDSLKFSVRDAKHSFLYKTLRPLATGLIKKQMAKAIGDGIRTGLEAANQQLLRVQERMREAKESESSSRASVFKEMFTSKASGDEVSSIDARRTSVDSKRQSKFKIVPSHQSMLLPDQGHEKGWIRKQQTADQRAQEGDGWRSKAFSIIPAAA